MKITLIVCETQFIEDMTKKTVTCSYSFFNSDFIKY